MKFETVVLTKNAIYALSKAQLAIEQLGYKLKSATSTNQTYKRGTFISSMVALSPQGWQSTVFLECAPSGLLIALDVNVVGGVALPSSIDYWERELSHICRLAMGEKSDIQLVKFKRPPVFKILSMMLAVNFMALAVGAVVGMILGTPLVVKLVGFIGMYVSIHKIQNYL